MVYGSPTHSPHTPKYGPRHTYLFPSRFAPPASLLLPAALYSGKKPLPRCSHQSVVFSGGLYVFGGELSARDSYHHYHDLWKLDLKTWKWEELKPRKGDRYPSSRSGHRVLVWR